MPGLSVNFKIASWLIAIEIAINIAMRLFSYQVEVVGNIICLIMLATAITVVSRGFGKIIGMLSIGYMINILADTLFFIPCYSQPNDWIFYAAWMVACIDLWHQKRYPVEINTASIAVLLAIAMKAYSGHSFLMFGERSMYEIGDAATHTLLAIGIGAIMIYRKPYIPVILFTCTVINLRDNISGDPYYFHWGEVAVLAVVCINLLWWWLRSRYAHTAERKRLFTHIIIAYHLLILGSLYIFR